MAPRRGSVPLGDQVVPTAPEDGSWPDGPGTLVPAKVRAATRSRGNGDLHAEPVAACPAWRSGGDAPVGHGAGAGPGPGTGVARALADSALPLAGTDPCGPLADLRPLGAAIGDVPVVGLGEMLHGSHELYTLKLRVFRYLVAEKGFPIFALEARWSARLLLDAYVRTGAGDPRRVMADEFGRGAAPWHVQEYLALVRWRREHNARRPRRQVRFLGTGLYHPRPGNAQFQAVTDHVGRHHPHLLDVSRGTTAHVAPTRRRPTSRRFHQPTATAWRAAPARPSTHVPFGVRSLDALHRFLGLGSVDATVQHQLRRCCQEGIDHRARPRTRVRASRSAPRRPAPAAGTPCAPGFTALTTRDAVRHHDDVRRRGRRARDAAVRRLRPRQARERAPRAMPRRSAASREARSPAQGAARSAGRPPQAAPGTAVRRRSAARSPRRNARPAPAGARHRPQPDAPARSTTRQRTCLILAFTASRNGSPSRRDGSRG
ncbi:hypothetical protein E1265_01785 [Streptomyces sp. 8K308]|nr:hypothetical protein E1265_01785 [Streptomyces sp. 8K308]